MSILGLLLSRESNDRREAKIDRLLSEDGIDPAQFDYREEAGVQVEGLNSQTNAQRLTAQHLTAQHCRQVVTPSPRRPPASSDSMLEHA